MRSEDGRVPRRADLTPAAVTSAAGTSTVPDRGSQAEVTDEELTELALAADPSAPLADDAVPIGVYLGQPAGLLPQWYMPGPLPRTTSRWRPTIVTVVVATLVAIEAAGLCSVFGRIVIG